MVTLLLLLLLFWTHTHAHASISSFCIIIKFFFSFVRSVFFCGTCNVLKFRQIFTFLANGFCTSQGGYHSYWTGTVQLSCAATDPSITTSSMQKVVFVTYLYYITKIIDLLDTVSAVTRYTPFYLQMQLEKNNNCNSEACKFCGALR